MIADPSEQLASGVGFINGHILDKGRKYRFRTQE